MVKDIEAYKEETYRLASQCNGRLDFQKKYSARWKIANTEGWLNEMFERKRILKWNKEKCREIAKFFKSVKDFRRHCSGHKVYINSEKYGWLEDFFPDDEETQKRICSRCVRELQYFQFSKDRKQKDGRASNCNDCKRIRKERFTKKEWKAITLSYSQLKKQRKMSVMNVESLSYTRV